MIIYNHGRLSGRLHIDMKDMLKSWLFPTTMIGRAVRNIVIGLLVVAVLVTLWILFGTSLVSNLQQSGPTTLSKSANLDTMPGPVWALLISVLALVVSSVGKKKRRGWKLYLALIFFNLYVSGASVEILLTALGFIAGGVVDLRTKTSYHRTGWISISFGIHTLLFLVLQAFIRFLAWIFQIESVNGVFYTDLPLACSGLLFIKCFSTEFVQEGKIGWITLFNQWIPAGSNIYPGLVCLPLSPKVFKHFIEVSSTSSISKVLYLGGEATKVVKIQTAGGDAEVQLSLRLRIIDTLSALNNPVTDAQVIEYVKGALTARLALPDIVNIASIKTLRNDVVKYVETEVNAILKKIHGHCIEGVNLIEAEETAIVRNARLEAEVEVIKDNYLLAETNRLCQRAMILVTESGGHMKFSEAFGEVVKLDRNVTRIQNIGGGRGGKGGVIPVTNIKT